MNLLSDVLQNYLGTKKHLIMFFSQNSTAPYESNLQNV